MTLDDLRRALRPLAIRLTNLVGRGVVSGVDDAKKTQELQVDLLDGETRDELERFQEYGFTSVPPVDSECLVVFVGGRRDQGYCVGTEDKRYRIKNLASGEVAVYNDAGAKIVLKSNGDIEVTPKSGQKLRLVGDMAITGNLTTTGSIVADGDVDGQGFSLTNHTHSLPAGSVAAAPGAVTFVPGPETGTPS